uniref:NAD(P)H-quinone oxidoreductase chain 4, chloroplastic n=1 Tax=Haplomitrium blumei TaxID=258993 RepID=A0A4Y5P7V2_9MARC|nr:NADH-plastoquinone oxidoreductase subunit 4 [Haplomitrium blumei]QCW59378.1 NADH-plastoquinone oxidoreductase subunit 4 [Haplomitrium blumei]
MNHLPWLTIIVLLPVSAGFMILPFPPEGNRIIRWYTLGICLLEFLLITYTFCYHFEFGNGFIQLGEDYNWIDSLDFHWRLGIDGLSMGLILLTGFITTLATLAAWPITRNPRLFYFLMLAMYSGQVGLFASRDLLLFFLMWELELLPVYLLLTLWGGKKRLYAATKFILYTAIGSVFILVAALTMVLHNNFETPASALRILATRSYSPELEMVLYISFLIAYAVKLPIIPFHTWLPDTHGEAHYSTCMLLAGILLKMGGYGLIRVNMELLPHAHSLVAPWLVALGALQIVYAALISLSRRNLKRRIAYSSVSHMGFVLIGIGSVTTIGLDGAILQMISHGLIGALLFFLAGITYDRIRTLSLDEMGGIAIPMPKLFTLFSFGSMASLALPGTSGFVAELMVSLGIVTNQTYSPVFKIFVVVIEAVGIVLTPVYLLSMLRQSFYGHRSTDYLARFTDIGPREIYISICLFLPILGIGLYPSLVLLPWSD